MGDVDWKISNIVDNNIRIYKVDSTLYILIGKESKMKDNISNPLIVGCVMLIIGMLIGQLNNSKIVDSIKVLDGKVTTMKISVETRFVSNEMNINQFKKDIDRLSSNQNKNYSQLIDLKDESNNRALRLSILESKSK